MPHPEWADEGGKEDGPGGVAPLGHGKRAGPAGDKFPRSGDAGNGGRVRSERQRTELAGTVLLSKASRPARRGRRHLALGEGFS